MSSNPEHIRRDVFFLLKGAVTCVQDAACTNHDLETARRNAQKAIEKIEALQDLRANELPRI